MPGPRHQTIFELQIQALSQGPIGARGQGRVRLRLDGRFNAHPTHGVLLQVQPATQVPQGQFALALMQGFEQRLDVFGLSGVTEQCARHNHTQCGLGRG